MNEFINKISINLQNQPKIIPMTLKEVDSLGWDGIDVLLITGDAYVDHPSFGTALIGRVLLAAGYTVGIIAQPDWKDKKSLKVLGQPKIACAISSGNMDSMLNIYTAGRKIRKDDAYSSGGKAGYKPPRALTVYANLAKQAFPGLPIILGGIEASMRRISHYDYWQDKILPSILTSTKADILLFGMAEKSIINTVDNLRNNKAINNIAGSSMFLGKKAADHFLSIMQKNYKELPSHESIITTKGALLISHKIAESECNPYSGKGLYQKYKDRLIVIEPHELPLTSDEMDVIYRLPFSNRPHPNYKEKIPAYEMIKDSITALRGCPGGCSFCGLGLHQGKIVSSRSEESIINSLLKLTSDKNFKGTVSDIGGPTANTYGNSVRNFELCKKCKKPSCLFPEICNNYIISENKLLTLLSKALIIERIKHVFISSGIRLDIASKQKKLMKQIIRKHTSGHLKVAPEHLDKKTLKLMRKNSAEDFYDFLKLFNEECKLCGKKQYIVPYFISNFPGCDEKAMSIVDDFLQKSRWSLQQVQDFIPLPMTIASAMYYEECDSNLNHIVVNKGLKARRQQVDLLKKKRKSHKNKGDYIKTTGKERS
ncbi:MAG: YgiQ family radical SAM protein [bacterium]|nr:YgiQ family radical SAM protein [bacterium]